jgi:hypothetical protein
MSTRRTPWFILCAVTTMHTAAYAQEKGQTGLTMGYPASLGVVWHLSDRAAIRPEISLSNSSSESQGSTPGVIRSSIDTWAVGVGVSGLFYVRKWDNLNAYVSPRFTYSRGTTTAEIGGLSTGPTESLTRAFSVSGSFGTQYSLSRKFSVFGEVGVGFSDSEGTTRLSPFDGDLKSTGHSWSTRTGIGVLFYF